jgi:uncharacterized protein YqeY
MGKLNEKIDSDLKAAMLAGDKDKVSVIRGMKSSLQYARVDAGGDLSEEDEIKTLQKESKKRADAIGIYINADDQNRAAKEKYEKEIIDSYLPELLSEEEVRKLVDEAVASQGEVTPQTMGKIIAEVRQRSGGLAEGSIVARLVKERMSQ